MEKEKLPDKEESKRESDQEAEELEEKEIVEPEKKVEVEKTPTEVLKEGWKPKTELGKKVLSGGITDIDEILDRGKLILEPEIVEVLLPELENDLLLVGQSRGKFGGGQRRIFKQTQKKTPEGNKISFTTYAIVGNNNGYIGLGWGKSNETVPARDKANREAKLSIKKIRRGCGSWLCGCKNPHSIPFKVKGKSGSVIVELIPAPKGKGLIIEEECGKMLKLAGINDVFCKTTGKTKTKINLVRACFNALKNLMEVKANPNFSPNVGLMEGKVKQ
ncbi:MAG: 30S ribosomal protein S5 [Nanoarchaeota archaeon]|nr:30S ribosomal protein S5 [Nanoarchaeota archaeon]